MANRERVEKLIAGWKAAEFARCHTAYTPPRGYNGKYDKPDIEHERARKEAAAAASLAQQILTERSTK